MNVKFEDLRQSEEWASYLSHLGWQSEELKIKNAKCKISVRRLPLVGSVAKIQRPSTTPSIEEINKVVKKYRALFVKLEPAYQGQRRASVVPRTYSIPGFEPDNWPLLPSKTVWVDLAPSKEEIWVRFSKDARYSIRKAKRSGVAVKLFRSEGKSLQEFHALFRETGKRKKFWVPPFADLQAKATAFKGKSVLILAYHASEPVAGAMILFHDSVAYYHHAASNLNGRRLLAPYLVVWNAIRLAQQEGCVIFDFEGIYDSRYRTYRRWRGISTFKKKFGGREIEYPGSYIRYYNPLIKSIFQTAEKLF